MSSLERQAAEVLETFPQVSSAWLFGSHSTGTARPDSDVDIAILTKKPLATGELIRLSGELSWELSKDRVDLVVLTASSPILAFEAISGKNILCRDLSFQAEFFSLVCRLYEDAMVMWKRGLSYRTA